MGDPKRISMEPASVKVKDFPLESQKDSRKTRKKSAVNSGVKAQREVEKKVIKKILIAGSEVSMLYLYREVYMDCFTCTSLSAWCLYVLILSIQSIIHDIGDV